MDFTYKTKDVCSQSISLTIDDNHNITNVNFVSGCSGNLQAIAKLVEGKKAEDLTNMLTGIKCGSRDISCASELCNAIREAVKLVDRA